ncbi:spore germination protein [Scopulibacillus cellulosilyticus]|uniref:Spore germination protein n=1 Tax=Scopulibacillus cellulosilyticus TaxID=2665665 RepID=A0ABW2Q3K2_9BACL
MPSILLSGVKINTLQSGGVINSGDSLALVPKTAVKTFKGSGGNSTGDFHLSNNYFSETNSIDSDINDTNIADI